MTDGSGLRRGWLWQRSLPSVRRRDGCTRSEAFVDVLISYERLQVDPDVGFPVDDEAARERVTRWINKEPFAPLLDRRIAATVRQIRETEAAFGLPMAILP